MATALEMRRIERSAKQNAVALRLAAVAGAVTATLEHPPDAPPESCLAQITILRLQ